MPWDDGSGDVVGQVLPPSPVATPVPAPVAPPDSTQIDLPTGGTTTLGQFRQEFGPGGAAEQQDTNDPINQYVYGPAGKPASVDKMALLTRAAPWLPPQTAFALASSSQPPDEMLQTVKGIHDAAQTSVDVFNQQKQAGTLQTDANGLATIDPATIIAAAKGGQFVRKGLDFLIAQNSQDPVLEKQESTGTNILRYLQNSLGVWPVAGTDVASAQKSLQRQGYGPGLPTDGVWNTAWQSAYGTYKDDVVKNELGGGTPGNVQVGRAMELFRALLPVPALDRVAAFTLNLPNAGRQVVSDLAGAAGMGAEFFTEAPFSGPPSGPDTLQAQFAGATNRALGGSESNAEIAKELDPNHVHLGRFIDDVGTMLALADTLGVGSKIALAGSRDAATQAVAGAADRLAAQGVEAGTGGGMSGVKAYLANVGAVTEGLSTRSAANAATQLGSDLGVQAAQRGPGLVARTLGRGLDLGDSNVFNNFPVMSKVGPWVASLNDADGLYYRMRTALASPLVVSPIGKASSAVTQIGGLGLRLTALGDLGELANAPQLAKINQGGVLDSVDDSIKRNLAFTAFGTHIAPSLNWLAFLAHPLEGQQQSLQYSQAMGHVLDATAGQAGISEIGSQIERGMTLGTGSPVHLEKLAEQVGGPERLDRWLTYMARDQAAHFYAEEQFRNPETWSAFGDRPAPGSADYYAFIQSQAHDAWTNPDTMDQALMRMTAAHAGNELPNRVARDIVSNVTQNRYDTKGINNLLDASDIVQNKLLPFDWTAGFAHPANGGGAPDALPHLVRDTSGSLGLAKTETLDQQAALRLVDQYRNAAVAADGDPEAMGAVRNDLYNTLTREFNVDPHSIPFDPIAQDDIDKKLAYIEQRASGLASRVFYADGAPDQVKQAFADLKDLGYKPVVGTDIGHMHIPTTPLTDFASAGRSRAQIMAGILGLRRVPDYPRGAAYDIIARREIQNRMDAGLVTPRIPGYTANTLLNELKDRAMFPTSPNLVQRVSGAMSPSDASSVFADYLKAAQAEAPENASFRDIQAIAKARADQDRFAPIQGRDLPRRQVVDFLTSPRDVPPDAALAAERANVDIGGGPVPPDSIGRMSPDSANEVYRALVDAAGKMPAYMTGLPKLEDLARASFGFMGKAPSFSIGKRLYDPAEAIANLPNELVRMRNMLRFQLNPEFSLRRFIKTNLKLHLDGVAPTMSPLKVMEKEGTLADSRATLDRVFPEHANLAYGDQVADDAAHYANDMDIFNLYRSRDFQSYAAGQMAQQGATDDQIRQRIIRDFDYGTYYGGEQGRSALERSANFLFFPFSFDKTLYRNAAAYLMDEPGRALWLSNALSAYHSFNKAHSDGTMPGSSSWFDQHLPVMNELSYLNAFAHGIGPGEFGGINRPLLNVFLPQSFAPGADLLSQVKSFAPVVGELDRVVNKEMLPQYKVGYAALHNFAKSGPDTPADPGVSEETKYTQIQEALQERRDTLADPMYKAIIDHNKSFTQRQLDDARRQGLVYFVQPGDTPESIDENAGDKAIAFSHTPDWGQWGGQPITKDLIDQVIHRKYPQFDPAFGKEYGIQQDKAISGFRQAVMGTPEQATFDSWLDDASTVSSAMRTGNLSNADEAHDIDILHSRAMQLAEQNANFYALYNRYFARYVGPLEQIRAVA